jgi:hypothetical protein
MKVFEGEASDAGLSKASWSKAAVWRFLANSAAAL